jgi:GntR family transcriptional regulator, transcriptional repressor for pyruvate dehydrogenase complex
MSDPTARAFASLIADMAASRLAPGDLLPDDAELGRRFGVAPEGAAAVVRELADRGLVDLAADGPATVSPESQWDVLDPRVLDVLLASAKGPAILTEYLEYRRVVEIVAAGMAADHATSADLAALSDALASMADAAASGAEARFHRADVAFHQTLLAAGGNRPLELAAGRLQAALCTARRPLARPELRHDRGLPEHQRILTAVAQGDPDAARTAMEAHLDTVEAYLRHYAELAHTTAGPDER